VPAVVDVASLAACPRLRRLSLLCYAVNSSRREHVAVTGLSALSQISCLRIEPFKQRFNFSGMGAQLAALEQLQVLEVRSDSLEASQMQPQRWLHQLRSLSKVVVLVKPRDRWSELDGMDFTDLVEQALKGTNPYMYSFGPADSSGRMAMTMIRNPAATSQVKCVQLAVWERHEQHTGTHPRGREPWAAQRAMQDLQWKAKELARHLPWLEVTAGLDPYTCPW
jgi:hypothetical protein